VDKVIYVFCIASRTQSCEGASAVECVIHGVEGQIRNNVVSLWWTLAKADTTDAFILEDATLGKLDSGGVLAFA